MLWKVDITNRRGIKKQKIAVYLVLQFLSSSSNEFSSNSLSHYRFFLASFLQSMTTYKRLELEKSFPKFWSVRFKYEASRQTTRGKNITCYPIVCEVEG